MKLDRTDKEVAREVFEFLLPDEIVRRKCAEFLARSIQTANQLAADRWGITLFSDFIRMNFGRIEVLAIWPDLIHVIVDSETLPSFSPELEVEVHGSDDNESGKGIFKTVHGSAVCNFPAEQVESVWPRIQESHIMLLQKAARTSRNSMTEKAHSPSVIEYLKDYLNQSLPQPTYFNASPRDLGQSQFELNEINESERLPDIEQEFFSATEGGKKFATHLKRERKPWLIKAKKRQVQNATGKLACEACSFDFKERYGDLGEDFAEAHHKTPLSAVEGEIETTLGNLAILCSNCHRMIHKTEPMESIAQFRERLR